MIKLIIPAGLMLVCSWIAANQQAYAEVYLSEREVRGYFGKMLNEDAQPYDIDLVKIQPGSFSKGEAPEALVTFYDKNQCHASGFSEVWVFSFVTGSWVGNRIADNDRIEVRTLKGFINNRQIIYLEGWCCFQGEMTYEYVLFELKKLPHTNHKLIEGPDFRKIFNKVGVDNREANSQYPNIKPEFHLHEINFTTAPNGAGVMIDVETKGERDVVKSRSKKFFIYRNNKLEPYKAKGTPIIQSPQGLK